MAVGWTRPLDSVKDHLLPVLWDFWASWGCEEAVGWSRWWNLPIVHTCFVRNGCRLNQAIRQCKRSSFTCVVRLLSLLRLWRGWRLEQVKEPTNCVTPVFFRNGCRLTRSLDSVKDHFLVFTCVVRLLSLLRLWRGWRLEQVKEPSNCVHLFC